MKKGISWLLLAVLACLFLGSFVSCGDTGSSPSEQSILLTKENYDKYLKVSARYYGGGDSSWSSSNEAYGYTRRIFDVSISPAASYLQFTGYCSLEIEIYGSYADSSGTRYNEHETLRVTLDIGGNGSNSTYTSSISRCYNLKGISYDVVSISGGVKVRS